MPLPASKSTSKREISASAAKQQSSVDSRKKNPLQRSKSASAVTRNYTKTPFASAGGDLSEFLNKRDNPLFSCSSLFSPEHESGIDGCSTRRGRSVSRSIGYGDRTSESRNHSTRSLSRVGSEGRLRVISRMHYDYSEREEDGECKEILSLRNEKKDVHEPKFQKNKGATSNTYSMLEQGKNLQTWSSRHPVSDYCNTSSSRSWEDGISISSLSELEEITIKESFTNSIVEVGPEMVNQDTFELVSDIRMEYETKLKESHERTRKLRADLAVEEQREQEISIMLKEIISDENSTFQKSRPRKKLSIERLEMSMRLTEDAMSYFDECVSISTFDSSDFSSTEDQQSSSIGIIPPLYGSRSLTSNVSTCTTPCILNGHLNHPEEVKIQSQSVSAAGTNLAAISSCNISQDVSFPLNVQKHKLSNLGELLGGSIEISSVCEAPNSGESHDFRTYIKRFEKEPNRSANITEVSSRFNIDDYDLDNSAERLLLDIVVFRNRIQSGSLLLCDIRTF